jgi:hypothetical protein
MIKEIYLIAAYTPNFKKQEVLRSLVHSINKEKKDVMVISHSPIPKDIEEMCKYTIFDSENKLIYDANIQFWSTTQVANKKFEFINLKSFTTILACWKLQSGGFSYLKSLGYDIVHYLEYDSEINDFTHFDEAKQIILDGEYDLIGFEPKTENEQPHLILPITLNLKKLSFDHLIYDEDYLISEYKNRYYNQIFPITETMGYDNVWSKLKIKVESFDKISDNIKMNENQNFIGLPDKYCLHTVNGVLHITHDNLTKLDGNMIDVIVIDKNKNNKSKTFFAPYYRCLWVNLEVNYVDAIYIRIFVNGGLFKELNLMNPKDRFYVESARIIEL